MPIHEGDATHPDPVRRAAYRLDVIKAQVIELRFDLSLIRRAAPLYAPGSLGSAADDLAQVLNGLTDILDHGLKQIEVYLGPGYSKGHFG